MDNTNITPAGDVPPQRPGHFASSRPPSGPAASSGPVRPGLSSRARWTIALTLVFVAVFVGVMVYLGLREKKDGPQDRRSGNSVSGKVTLNDQPVNGTVSFVGGDGKPFFCPTNEAGFYMLDDTPPGKYTVTIRAMGAPPPVGNMKFELPEAPKFGATPPARYADPKKSPLSFEITKGEQTFDIKLEPQ